MSSKHSSSRRCDSRSIDRRPRRGAVGRGALERVRPAGPERPPGQGTRGNIDHIVIGPAGIFVVDAKAYDGLIEIRDVGPFWHTDRRPYVGRRDQSRLAEGMTWQVEAVEDALAAAGIEPPPPVTPVLCFVDGEWPIFRPPKEFMGVRLESVGSIKRLVQEPVVLDATEIEGLTRVLAEALPAK